MMDFVSFLWPVITYKLSEFYKKIVNGTVQADTCFGPVTGLKQTAEFGYEYIEFLGIPYAKPPIGPLRFKDPEPPEPWTEPLSGVANSVCCQRDIIVFQTLVGSEDCLRLNVYTKNFNESKLQPVMVFIHGGAFLFGSNTKDMYNPEFMLQKNVVLVVINYRLGAFGFLSIDDPTLQIPGNAGLKDQVMALKWVRKNIQNFGGDPSNITIFGESAGGCSVHYHMLSDMSRGLFHKAIAMSGTVLNLWSIGQINTIPERLARNLGWNGEGGYAKIVEVLRSVSAKKLTQAQDDLITNEERMRLIIFPFGPIVEPYQSEQCFIPKSPMLMSREPWAPNMPLIIGGCSGEGLLFYKMAKKNKQFMTRLNDIFEYMVPRKLEEDPKSEKCKRLGAQIRHEYFGDSRISFDLVDKYLMMLSDIWFWHGIHCAMKSRLNNSNTSETYLYRFDFDSQLQNHSKFVFAGRGVPGACHGDECPYLFKNALVSTSDRKSREFKTVQRMVNLWTSFAHTGKPTNDVEHTPNWQPIESGKPFKCLNISDKLEFIELPENERMAFWDSLYDGIELY